MHKVGVVTSHSGLPHLCWPLRLSNPLARSDCHQAPACGIIINVLHLRRFTLHAGRHAPRLTANHRRHAAQSAALVCDALCKDI